MFVTTRGRRCFLIHGYRDGRGKVCQLRLGHFLDEAGLNRLLDELPARHPELQADYEQVRRQGQARLAAASGAPSAAERAERIRRKARVLRNLLAEEEDLEVLGQVARELEELRARLSPNGEDVEREAGVKQCLTRGDLEGAEGALCDLVKTRRNACASRRQRLDEAEPFLRSLDRLEEVYRQQGRLEDGLEVLLERVARCPSAESRLRLGLTLQRLGRSSEAVAQYALMPVGDARRYYNSAAAHWSDGRHAEALEQILAGYSRQSEIPDVLLGRVRAGPGASYWREFAELWPIPARRFLLAACNQTGVRWSIYEARQTGIRKRRLISARSQARLLEHAVEASQNPAWPVIRGTLPLRDWMLVV